MNTNLGTAIPLSSALPQRRSAVEFYGDHRRNKSAREDHRGDAPPIDVGEQYASILANAAPKGAIERRQISPLEATAIEARQAAAAGTAAAVAVPDMSQVLSLLAALLDRLNALEARVSIIDGASEGAA